MQRTGHKQANGELNGEVKANRDNSVLRKVLRNRRNNEETGRHYFSSIKIFDRQRSCNRSKDSKEEREGNSSCPLCNVDKPVENNEKNEEDEVEVSTSNRTRSLLQPPFKPLSTPGESLIENEVILIKVCCFLHEEIS